MATATDDRTPEFLLTTTELEEFRALARKHAGTELSADEARALAGQLLRVLVIVRDVELGGSSVRAGSVENTVLRQSDP